MGIGANRWRFKSHLAVWIIFTPGMQIPVICAILIFWPQVLLHPSQCLFFLRKNDAYASFNLSCSRVGIRRSWVTTRNSFHCTSLKGRKQEAGKRSRKYQQLAYFSPILSLWCDCYKVLTLGHNQVFFYFTFPPLSSLVRDARTHFLFPQAAPEELNKWELS